MKYPPKKKISRLGRVPAAVWFFSFSILVFVVSLTHLQGVGAEGTAADYQKYSRENVSLRKAITLYHKDMNELFNNALEELLKKTPDDPDVLPPLEGEECPGDHTNVSTYCVAMAAVDQFDAFSRALQFTHSPYFYDPGFVDEEEGGVVTLGDVWGEQFSRSNVIDEQLALAEKTLDVTLSVYSEVYLYYNLHTEYWNLIKDLEKFRDGLAGVRQQVEHYPNTFQNRTTTECT
jgi:hypothetical protein